MADVSAGNKSLVACASQHHAADRCICCEHIQSLAHAIPHRNRHGIPLFGLVEGNAPNAILDFGKNFAFCEFHLTYPSLITPSARNWSISAVP